MKKNIQSYQDWEIHKMCKEHDIRNYTINPDRSIDADGYVDLHSSDLTRLPLKFNKVEYFDCSHNLLTSLEGSPIEVNDFYCDNNLLTSFEHAPKIIRGDFYCEWNNIKTFEYFPSYVGDDFICFNNPIEEVWDLFQDTKRIELLNDFDIFRDEDTETPAIVMDRLNDFLLTIGKDPVEKVYEYKNI